jgi:O-antigen/teichoic acid export membrane protein
MLVTQKSDQNTIDPKINAPDLTGSRLTKNSIYNLIGQILPMLVAVFTIPLLIKGLGVGRFGILTLAWMIVGYFSLFDLGLGRATTKFVSDYLSKGDSQKINQSIWASILLIQGVGAVVTISAILIMPWIVNNVLNISPELRGETLTAFYLLALSIPIVSSIACVRGVLEALQRFDLINYVKVPTYIAAFVVPLLVLPFTNSLVPIVLVLIGCRLVGLVFYSIICVKSLPGLIKPQLPDFKLIKRLLGFGGWLTVSNLIWPLMTYMDRFIVGAMLTMSAVAYYTTPYELVGKLLIITGSLTGVIFPAFSVYANGKHNQLLELHNKSIKYLLLILVPVVFAIIILAQPFFQIWLGDDFARNSAIVMQILAIAILINSVSQVTSSAIQAMGRPDLSAKLHLIEFPIYLALIWFLISNFGIMGAALAWLCRTVLDSSLYFWLFYKVLPIDVERRTRPKTVLIVWAISMLGLGFFISAISVLSIKIAFLSVSLFGTALYYWFGLLEAGEKEYLTRILNKLFRRRKQALEYEK